MFVHAHLNSSYRLVCAIVKSVTVGKIVTNVTQVVHVTIVMLVTGVTSGVHGARRRSSEGCDGGER